MKLTKDVKDGANLWLLEAKAKDGGVVRWMLQTSIKRLPLDDQNARNIIAQDLMRARRDLRNMAELPPPA
ncbi:hypothetical protein MQ4_30 [Serratia phage MQ-4]|nr:hypothetical protein MQ4_30 [Serratia phage MQ-4]